MAKAFTTALNSKPCSIGLLMHSGHEHMRQISLGVVEFHRGNPEVQLVGDGFNPLVSWSRLDHFQGDGLIAIVESQEELDALKKSSIPFVLVNSRFLDEDLSLVASDNRAIGAMAGKHLVSCGLKNFMFIGSLKWDDEKLRYEGFREYLSQQKLECSLGACAEIDYPAGDQSSDGLPPQTQPLIEILEGIKKHPVGVFCPSSLIARATNYACQALGLTVPDQIAIVSVNDDPILCETSDPPLSTIVQSSNSIGFHAAKLLSEQLRYGVPTRQIFLPPRRLSVRRSSDLLIVGNETVEAALRFMRDHAQNEIEITDIANHVDVSRRTLELKFREVLQSTPRQELLRMRLDVAKSLLTESEISITEIALRSGFGGSQAFSTIFKKELGVTPSKYRSKRLGFESE